MGRAFVVVRETDNLTFIQCEVQYAPYMIFVIDFDLPVWRKL